MNFEEVKPEETTTENTEEQDNENEKERADKIKEIASELGNYLNDQIVEINKIDDVDKLVQYLKNSTDSQDLAEMAEKSAGVGMEIIRALYMLRYMPIELSHHVEKNRALYEPFSRIKENVEKDISDLPGEVQGKAKEYVNALVEKVEEITGEYKEN